MKQLLLKYLKYLPLHIGLWMLVWGFYVYFFSYSANNINFVFWFSTSLLPITMITTYVMSYVVIPKYLLQKKYVQFGIYVMYTIVCSLLAVIIVTFINFVYLSDFRVSQMPLLTRNFVFVLILVYLVVGLMSFIRLLYNRHEIANKNQELENKLLETQLQHQQKELHFLKEQIQPHFLFNTLNTLYGFALAKSEETPELILKLSNLMDYILYQTDKPSVAISKEIKHIDSYIGLEKVRFRDHLKISFTKDIKEDLQVPPLLFITYIENAFKHGNALNGFLDINMDIQTKDGCIYFTIKNSIANIDQKKASHGFGLKNNKKRLDTLFPNAYSLEIGNDAAHYYVNLKIKAQAHELSV